MIDPRKVVVFGARGYTGIETTKILFRHPHVSELILVSSDAQWTPLDDCLNSRGKNVSVISREKFFESNFTNHTVFLACSAEESFEAVTYLKNQVTQIIDLSGAHRLDVKGAKTHYGLQFQEDNSPKQYGMVPFNKVTNQTLVANPGCYVSSVLMAIVPLLKAKAIDPQSIFIDAKSGTSGAGKSPKAITNFSEIATEMVPYKIGQHQHLPEIIRFAKYFTEASIDPIFTTTLVPIPRGILSTLFLKLTRPLDGQEVVKIYQNELGDYPFYSVKEISQDQSSLHLNNVLFTNFTQLGVWVEGNRLTVFSMIDNLIKGAAGQAIENFNLLNGFPLSEGLL